MLSAEISMFGPKSSITGSEVGSGGTKFGSRSFRGAAPDAQGEGAVDSKPDPKEDKEQRRLEAIAYNKQKLAEKKQVIKWDPWDCFVSRRTKQKYPWQDFTNQERIVATPTRHIREEFQEIKRLNWLQ